MSTFQHPVRPRASRVRAHLVAVPVVASLLMGGVAVTATSAPGPETAVKAAAYGTKPSGTSNKAKLNKALAKCKKKSSASARSKCRQAARKKYA